MKSINKIWSFKLWWLFLLILVVAINFLASSFHARLDLTKEKRYTLSKATKQLLKNLNEPVMIDVFLKGDFPSGFKKLSLSTSELLKEFKENGKRNIIYNFYEPDEMISADRKYADTLVSMGAAPINLTVQLKAGEQQQYVFPVAWIRYKDRSTLVNLYTGGKRVITPEELNSAEALMEYQFVNAINKITQEIPAMVGYALGNGEPVAAEVQDLIEGVLRPNYDLRTLNLAMQPIIPDTFKVLMIVKPTTTFIEDEKFKLDQYVMRGGKIIWMIDDLAAEMDSLKLNARTVAFERNLNLTDQLFRYGARINPDLVMDLQCDFLPFIAGGTPENPQYEFLKWNYFPLFESKNNHPINKNLRLVSSRFINSIDTVKAEGIKKTFLLQSSANSRKIGTPAIISLDENRNAPEDEKFKTNGIPVAVLLEGKFRSLYEGRVSKDKADTLNAKGTPFIGKNNNDNKMIIIADGDMALNDFSPQQQQILPMGLNKYTVGTNYEYQFANRDFILNCLEYMVNDVGIMETRNKDFVLRVLDTKKISEQKLIWQIINIVVPLLLVILLGVIYQMVRKMKYSR
ncbi:MAG TPA: gliding motility-associated ABC transporter substrate-binding protein GldG [Chitinophagaceae bacterium]|jgi:gliding-associated putative ABC transporter substrate-binding component GldG|nr:gliding motility-associated ABC transporter substrate-binding protein GldG [Chitinophagaceae bacterium]